jgi:hypothetical protein
MAVEDSINTIRSDDGKHAHFLYYLALGSSREKMVTGLKRRIKNAGA